MFFYYLFGPIAYTVADGYLMPQVEEGEEAQGIIGPGGDFIVSRDRDDTGDSQGVIFMLRSSNVGPGSLYGTYNLTSCTVDTENGGTSAESEHIFVDGNGGWTKPDEGLSGTYEIEAGRLVLEVTSPMNFKVTDYGAVSPDGSLFLVPETDSDNLGISLAVKMPPAAVAKVESSSGATISSSDSESRTLQELQEEFSGVPDDFQPYSEVVRFTADVSQDCNEFTFETTGLAGAIEDLQLWKLKADDSSLPFNYATSAEAAAGETDGTWWISTAGTYRGENEKLNQPQDPCTIHFVICDNGPYDLDPTAGTIEDPTVLGSRVAPTTTDPGSDPGAVPGVGGGGSSGCFIRSLQQ